MLCNQNTIQRPLKTAVTWLDKMSESKTCYLVVTRFNGALSGHHFSQHIYVKYSGIYGRRDRKK